MLTLCCVSAGAIASRGLFVGAKLCGPARPAAIGSVRRSRGREHVNGLCGRFRIAQRLCPRANIRLTSHDSPYPPTPRRNPHHAYLLLLLLRRSPPNKLLQIPLSRNPQHKSPPGIRHNRELLPLPRSFAVKKPLQLLQRRLQCNHPVPSLPSPPLKPHHSFLHGICISDFVRGKELAEVGCAEVA